MILDGIGSPDDLRELSDAELAQLADELRTAIVDAVSRVGGHLGSNLGAVELTIALHRVFDSPNDRLVWDTGHQAYVHKMLTGRRDFSTLRQAGGLSGYPSREESDHDIVENSHASTALSWASGLARGQMARPPDDRNRVIAVVGDGALTGGMAYEALNNLGHHQLPAIIVLNDNGRSYAETVSRLSGRVADLRTDPRYRGMRDRWDVILARAPRIERVRNAAIEGVKSVVSEAPALQSFVEALGVRYLGPYDGHDIEGLERALWQAARLNTPVLVHVLTQKGKGYEPAETDRVMKLHDTSAFDIVTGRKPSSGRRWTQVFTDHLLDLADAYPELVGITAAMPGSTGLLPLAARDPDRVLDVGIAEQHAVTSAAGLANAGRLPIVAVYSTFFARAFDQANLDVGLHNEHVVFVLDRAGITGDDGPSHHGILDMALGLRIAAMSVLAPSHEEDLKALLSAAVAMDGPVLIRFPKGTVTTAADLDLDGSPPPEGLDARCLRQGADACILAVGDRARAALAAADLLAEDDIEVAVWDVRSVRPADPAMLDAASASPLVVTVENGVVGGGAGSELADRLTERAGVRHAPPILRLGVPATYLPHGKPDHILSEIGLDAPGIAAATRKVLADDR
ncbi:MAG: 1-deoxy-D-xylulose-5-phosphate synthase [Nitriliruptor sp.]|nr:MAG: 1-deoxy-D-xylulose-5-phosphate synthase [Nitriliruptor sp.]